MIASFWLWLISDVRNWIIVALVILLAGTGTYCVVLKWQVADKDQTIASMKIDNEKLKINNTNLSMQVEQLDKANKACNTYVTKIFSTKDKAKKTNDRIDQMKGQQDEIILNNDLVSNWNSGR